MSSKRRSVFGGVVALALTTGVVASQGCGSSSSGNFLAACETACNKEAACAGYPPSYSTPICMSSCQDDNRTAQSCENLSTLVSMANACNAISNCTSFENCINGVADCQVNTGSGGSNGSGGSSGSGGSGGADCSICAHSHTCCLATDVQFGIPDGAGCEDYTEAQCTSLTGSARTQYIATCSNELLAGQTLYVSACQ